MVEEFMGHRLPQSMAEKLSPASTALIVIDAQNDFIHDDGYFGGSAALQRIVSPIQQLVAGSRAAGVRVCFVNIVQESDGSALSPVWISEALRRGYEPYQCMRGTWGAENVRELAPSSHDAVYLKRRRSAFRGTSLDHDLRDAGITTVVLTGLAADGCVEYTARDALERDFHPIIALDAVANAGDARSHSWGDHYARFMPSENLLETTEILSGWKK